MKRISMIVLCLVMVLGVVVGCGGGSEPAASTGTPAAKATLPPKEEKKEDVNNFEGYWYAEEYGTQCMAMYADGTVEFIDEDGVQMEGEYSFEGDTGTVTMDGETVNIDVSGDTMTMTSDDDPGEEVVLTRGDAPNFDVDDDTDYSDIADKWYLDGDLDSDYVEMDTAGNVWLFGTDDEVMDHGTYTWDGTYAYLTLADAGEMTFEMEDYNTLQIHESNSQVVRESACGTDAGDGEYYSVYFENSTGVSFDECYIYEDSTEMGDNLFEALGDMEPGAIFGVDTYVLENTSISLMDEDDDEWYFALVMLEDMVSLEVTMDGTDPMLLITYDDGTTDEVTGSFY